MYNDIKRATHKNKLDFIKIKSFCFLKDTIKKKKRQATDWEKIFKKHISDKGLVFRIYRELTQQIT